LLTHVPAWFAQRSWGGVNEAIGQLVAYGAVELFGAETHMYEQVQVVEVKSVGSWGAFTLGDKVIGDPWSLSASMQVSKIPGVQHEQGHYYQNLILGPFYLLGIGLPSLVHGGLHDTIHPNQPYEDFYTETWASSLGK
jgi:hypothetical protein